MVSGQPRSRKEIREKERLERRFLRHPSFLTGEKLVPNLPRVMLLGFLATVTVVAPITGLVSPDLSVAVPNGGYGTDETLLSLVSSAGNVSPYDSDLNAVPASTRSRLVEAQQLSGCVTQEDSANGDVRAAQTKKDLVWPMYAGTYVYTSPWGVRIHPITGQRMMHEGVDWAAPAGSHIYAVADGEVVEAGMMSSTGVITIKHKINGEVFYSRYLHMYANGIYVSKGDKVKAGDLIGAVGSTGRSTGPHLHFEIRNADKDSIEPMSFMRKNGAVYLNGGC